MTKAAGDSDQLHEAIRSGRTFALAVACQRDLSTCAERYPDLFPARPFDSALFGAVAAANAFGAPWMTAGGLRPAARTSLWIFGVDWLIDHAATAWTEVAGIRKRCLAVADGGSPGADDDLARFLACLRDDLSAAPAYRDLCPLWREELRRMLDAMAREWTWKSAREQGGQAALPDLGEYLANADNFGSSWVNISHWIAVGDAPTLAHLDRLRAVSAQVQRVLRLLNDLATYERDVSWGDLNVLMLGVERAEVMELIAALVADCRSEIESLRAGCPEQAVYLERQIGYSTGFYGLGDYWGAL